MVGYPRRAASRITLAPGEAVREANERSLGRDRLPRTQRSAFDADADTLESVVRNAVALALVSLSALGFARGARDPGCGGADSPSSGPNAPCTRTKDCAGDLVCREGVCTEADSGAGNAVPDGGGRDATSSADAADDGG
jgi:hypothetical protein